MNNYGVYDCTNCGDEFIKPVDANHMLCEGCLCINASSHREPSDDARLLARIIRTSVNLLSVQLYYLIKTIEEK